MLEFVYRLILIHSILFTMVLIGAIQFFLANDIKDMFTPMSCQYLVDCLEREREFYDIKSDPTVQRVLLYHVISINFLLPYF